MSTIPLGLHNPLRYFDLRYLLKFIFLFLAFYYFNIAFVGLITPDGKLYSPFLEAHLNYIAWFKASILFTSHEISGIIGLPTVIPHPNVIQVVHGIRLIVGDSCLGLGVMSFWLAYILADKNPWKKKLAWAVGGLISIWLINCLRVVVMLFAFEYKWHLIITSDYHFAFNVIAYIFVFAQILVYNKLAGKRG